MVYLCIFHKRPVVCTFRYLLMDHAMYFDWGDPGEQLGN